MLIRRFYLLFSSILLVSCMPEEDLPLRNVGEAPEYFIECYCKPGKTFSLSATTVLPVSENLEIDFSAEMNVIIRARQDIKLYHTLFTLPGSEFIYNYGTTERFESIGLDSLYLFITTDKGKIIQGVTAIPSPVYIYDYSFQDNKATIHFYASAHPSENYYIYSAEIIRNDSVFHKEMCYLNYESFSSENLLEKTLSLPETEPTDQIILSLKRLTRENYDYQISLNAANTANQSSITTPVPLQGNLQGALGIFTCYTEHNITLFPSPEKQKPGIGPA